MITDRISDERLARIVNSAHAETSKFMIITTDAVAARARSRAAASTSEAARWRAALGAITRDPPPPPKR